MTRSNGLGASRFVPVAEFSPSLDDHTASDLLGKLERVGVAAYLEPMAAGDMLLVDARHARTAAAMLTKALEDDDGADEEVAPSLPGDQGRPLADDERVRWQELMADFDEASPDVGWPQAESGSFAPPRPHLDRAAPVPHDPLEDDLALDGLEDDEDDEVDAFVPEPPPPMPRPSLHVVSGWVCAILIPLVIVVLGFLGVILPTWLLMLVGGFFVYGLAVLFGQLRSEPEGDDEDDDDGDSGARI